MGFYLDPKTVKKEEFLALHGILVASNREEVPAWITLAANRDHIPIACIKEVSWYAMLILYDEREYDRVFKRRDGDQRPVKTWLVPKRRLYEVHPEFIDLEDLAHG